MTLILSLYKTIDLQFQNLITTLLFSKKNLTRDAESVPQIWAVVKKGWRPLT